MERDFTYIDDIIEGLVRILAHPRHKDSYLLPGNNTQSNHPPYKLYNIGNHQPVKLLTFIETIEKRSKRKQSTT
jgi:UDP-glucuronate 4-epimerase